MLALLHTNRPTFLLPCLLLLVSLHPTKPELMAHEPVEHLKGYLERLPFDEGLLPWQQFLGLQPRELKNATHAITKNLRSALDQETSVRLLKGENVLIEKLAPGVKYDTPLELPSANTLSLLGLAIPILLEGYKPQTLTDPIGRLLKDDHRSHPLVRGRESLSLLELIRDLPPTEEGVLTDRGVLSELGKRGELAVYVINSLLGSLSAEAWLDALLLAGMEHTKFSTEGDPKMVTTLTELGYFAAAISQDTSVSQLPPKSDLFPLNSDRFLFSWWFNCPQGRIDESHCLLPLVPAGTILSVSPRLRIYILPGLDLSLMVANHSKSLDGEANAWHPSVSELVKTDRKIWKQFYSVLVPSSSEEVEEEGGVSEEEGYVVVWYIIVFVFIIILSHIWVYWMFHAVWYCLSLFKSVKVYAPRPKTAKKE